MSRSPVHEGHEAAGESSRGEAEAGVLLQAQRVQRDDRHVRHARVGKGLADEGDVVGGPAPAARLGDEERRAVQVVAARAQRRHHLAHHEDGGEAGVVVDGGEALVHRARGPPRGGSPGCSPESRNAVSTMRKWMGDICGREDRVALPHLLREHRSGACACGARGRAPFPPSRRVAAAAFRERSRMRTAPEVRLLVDLDDRVDLPRALRGSPAPGRWSRRPARSRRS